MPQTQSQKTKKLQSESTMYRSLEMHEVAPLQQREMYPDLADEADEPAAPEQLHRPYSSLSKDEKKAEKKKYKEAKARNSFVTAKDMESPYMQDVLSKEVEVSGEKITQRELFNRVSLGDCTHMQDLDSVLRNRAATKWMSQNHPISEHQTPEQFIQSLKYNHPADYISEMMNPLLRMGISCVINSPDVEPAVVAKYRKIDELLNKEIMIATITKKVPGSTPGYTREEREQNLKAQVFIFKTMLTCHLGRMRVKDSKKTPPVNEDWHGAVANAFAHCSRVMITLPGAGGEQFSEQRQEAMFQSFNKKAGFDPRLGATHTMSRKKKGSDGEAKEVKFFSPRSQYGLNVAVGGMGNNGIPDATGRPRLLRNDGSCGHLFMHFEEGTKSKHAGMLIGFESDAYKKMNQTGHVHDKKATGEFASSFGGQRCDEIGDKYGGRVVDMSGCDEVAYTELMNLVDSLYTQLLTDQVNGNPELLKDIADRVCGDLMDQSDVEYCMRLLCASVGRYDLQNEAVDMVRRLHMPQPAPTLN